jgi:hypothetical protein
MHVRSPLDIPLTLGICGKRPRCQVGGADALGGGRAVKVEVELAEV